VPALAVRQLRDAAEQREPEVGRQSVAGDDLRRARRRHAAVVEPDQPGSVRERARVTDGDVDVARVQVRQPGRCERVCVGDDADLRTGIDVPVRGGGDDGRRERGAERENKCDLHVTPRVE
jgi:hypothetical protein